MTTLDAQKRFELESLDALFEHATEGIIITNQKGGIIRANPSSERMFGYGRGELQHKTVEELVPTRYKDTHVHNREGYNKTTSREHIEQLKALFYPFARWFLCNDNL